MKKSRFVVVATLFMLTLRADDEITFPLDFGGGLTEALVVRAKLMQAPLRYSIDKLLQLSRDGCPSAPCIGYEVQEVGGTYLTSGDLSKTVVVKLQFDVGGLCDKKPRQWSPQTDERLLLETTKRVFHLADSEGCRIDLVRATLISVTDGAKVIARNKAPEVDFTGSLSAIQDERDAEEARQQRLATERKRKDVEEARDAARQARIQAAEASAEATRRAKIQLAEAARLAKIQAAEDAKAAEERAKIRAACGVVYQSTIDKKVTDLTVREEQQVRACQALRFYPPR